MALNPYTEARIAEEDLGHVLKWGIGAGFLLGVLTYILVRPILISLFLMIDKW